MSKLFTLIFGIKSLHAAAGTEKATITIANGLAERGHQIHIVVLEKIADPFFAVSPEVKVTYIWPEKDNRPFFTKIPSRLQSLRKLFLEINPDLIVQVGSGRSMLFLPPSKGFNFATWEHFNIKINWNLLQPFSKFLASKVGDQIITLTETDAISYKNKFGADAVCIPNAFDLTDRSFSTYDVEAKTISATGRLTHQKGFDLLIHAWSKTKIKSQGWRLQVIGSGKDEHKLKKLAFELDVSQSVDFIPTTTNAIQHMSESAFFVLSSRYEGLPLVMIEAMAIGLPMVAFDCYTGPRELISDGVNGLLVEPFDIQAFAKSMDILAANKELRLKMSKAATLAAEKFTIPTILDRWEFILNSKQ